MESLSPPRAGHITSPSYSFLSVKWGNQPHLTSEDWIESHTGAHTEATPMGVFFALGGQTAKKCLLSTCSVLGALLGTERQTKQDSHRGFSSRSFQPVRDEMIIYN